MRCKTKCLAFVISVAVVTSVASSQLIESFDVEDSVTNVGWAGDYSALVCKLSATAELKGVENEPSKTIQKKVWNSRSGKFELEPLPEVSLYDGEYIYEMTSVNRDDDAVYQCDVTVRGGQTESKEFTFPVYDTTADATKKVNKNLQIVDCNMEFNGGGIFSIPALEAFCGFKEGHDARHSKWITEEDGVTEIGLWSSHVQWEEEKSDDGKSRWVLNKKSFNLADLPNVKGELFAQCAWYVRDGNLKKHLYTVDEALPLPQLNESYYSQACSASPLKLAEEMDHTVVEYGPHTDLCRGSWGSDGNMLSSVKYEGAPDKIFTVSCHKGSWRVGSTAAGPVFTPEALKTFLQVEKPKKSTSKAPATTKGAAPGRLQPVAWLVPAVVVGLVRLR